MNFLLRWTRAHRVIQNPQKNYLIAGEYTFLLAAPSGHDITGFEIVPSCLRGFPLVWPVGVAGNARGNLCMFV